MRAPTYLTAGLIVCLIALVFLIFKIWSLSGEIRAIAEKNDRAAAGLGASIKNLQAELEAAKEAAPGLGEYMTTFQLHMGKLWFAGKAANWDLAEYERGELDEAMEAAGALHAVKNDVDIAKVLASVRSTQIAGLAESIKQKNDAAFQKAYDETLTACNGCHESAGYKFIRLVRPSAPPVTNQKWDVK